MKLKLQLAAASAALLLTSGLLPVYAANPCIPQEAATEDPFTVSGGDFLPEKNDSVSSGDIFPSPDNTVNQTSSSDETPENAMAAPAEAPTFTAHIEYSPQGYVVVGTFTDFLPSTRLVQPMYSSDEETWHACRTTWDLHWLGSEAPDDLKALQNQKCLFDTHEPLTDYLAGRLDRFCLKLQITLENGITYETQAAVIDRGNPQPIPEEYSLSADFTPDIRIRQFRPFKSQGQYQITVSADDTPENISALLPDTLPVNVQLYSGIDFIADAVVDCPVTWKPLSLPGLIPGEPVTVEDAAEEIIIPAGTLLNTPNGIFRLSKPLAVDHDEVRLILNVTAENPEPTGTLRSYFAGLEISFDLKPTGATAIRAYTFSEGESSWSEVSEPLLPETVNAPSSTASSLFTFVLTKAQEPYRSWLAAWNAGEEPTPFLVGLTIQGGVYDGQQLILAFPDTYETPVQPPKLNGSGGNECNAGSDNKNDSTAAGQRPGLPQTPADDEQTPVDDEQDTQQQQTPTDNGQSAQQPQAPADDEQSAQQQQTPADNEQSAQQPQAPATPTDNGQSAQQQPAPTDNAQSPQTHADDEQHGASATPADDGQHGAPDSQDTARISGRKPQNPLRQVESARDSLSRRAAELPAEKQASLSVSALNNEKEKSHTAPMVIMNIAAAIVCLTFVLYGRIKKHPVES